MVDENSLGAVGGGKHESGYFRRVAIKKENEDRKLLDYQIIQSFQTLFDIALSKNECYKAYWPVFHFLPGNFEPSWYPPDLESFYKEDRKQKDEEKRLWKLRIANPIKVNDSKSKEYFQWLTRPYSPMAVTLIRNCTDLVNDPISEVCKYGLSDYLIGITMHVFIDTWAHQDFVGYTSKSINGIYQGPIKLEDAKETKFYGTQDKALGVLRLAKEDGSTWLGHGTAGHWPDHSGMSFMYIPNWGTGWHVRDNPKEYMEAFVNMIAAIKCITSGKRYLPITVDDARREYGINNLDQIDRLIRHQRQPDGSGTFKDIGKKKKIEDLNWDTVETVTSFGRRKPDPWDYNMYLFNSEWISMVHNIFGGDLSDYPDWIPGKSSWIKDAKNAVGKKGWITPEQFLTLDYFKFNVAAKFHFRFVEQQLKGFGQKLLEDWPVGFAYANDLTALEASPRNDLKKGEIVNSLRNLQNKARNTKERDELSTLLNQVEIAPYGKAAQEIIKRAISDWGEQEKNINNQSLSASRRGIQFNTSTISELKKISGAESVSIKVSANTNIDPSISGFLDMITGQDTINSLAKSLIESTDEYIINNKSDPKSTGIKRARSFIAALEGLGKSGGDGNYSEEDLGDLFYNLFAKNKVGNESFAVGVFGLRGAIQTTENSLFTFAVNGLINDPLFAEARMPYRARLRAIPANKKLTMTSGYAAKGECMCIRRLLFRFMDMDPSRTTPEGKTLIGSNESAILLNAVKNK